MLLTFQKGQLNINLNKYQFCQNDLNKILKEFNSKQTNLFDYYIEKEKANLNIYYLIIKNLIKIKKIKQFDLFVQIKSIN